MGAPRHPVANEDGGAVQPVPTRIEDRILPLEPRLLLDANLEWDLSGTTALTSALSGVAQIFEQQFGDVSAFLDTFGQSADQAFAAVETVVDTTGALGTDDLNAVTEAVSRIKEAITALRDATDGSIAGLLDGTFAADVAAGFNNRLNTANGNTAADFTTAEVAGLYAYSNFADGTVTADRDAFLTANASRLGSVDVATATGLFDDAVAGVLGLPGGNLSVALADIALDGQTIIDFTQTTATSVGVSVVVPDTIADFGEVLQKLVPGISLPFDVSVGSDGALLGFDIDSRVALTGDTLDAIGVDIHDFTFAPLLELGGPVTLPADASLKLGILELEATSLETARLGLFVTPSANLNLGGEVAFTGTPGITFFGDGASIEVDARIWEAGAGAYADILADTSYDLVTLDAAGTLDFSATPLTFATTLTLSTILDTEGAAGRIQTFLENATIGFDVDLSGAGLDPALQAQLEQAIGTLAAMGTGDVIQFLLDVGDTVAGALRDAAFDVAVPLTDLNLGAVMAELAGFFTGLAERFAIDKALLGFVEDIERLSFSPTIDTQTADTPTTGQLDALAGFDRLTFEVFTGTADAEGNPTPTAVTVDIAGTDVVNTALDAASRMSALAQLLTAQLGSFGLAFSVTGSNALRVTSDVKPPVGSNPPTYNTFSLTAARKLDQSVDGDFSLADLGFGPGTLTAVSSVNAENRTEAVLSFLAEATSGDLGALQLDELTGVTSLRFSFVVDGIAQSLDVKGGATGWASLAALVTDFNTALDAAGIGLTAGINAAGDGLGFTLDAGETRAIDISTNAGDLLRALDVDGLIGWVNAELTKVLPGASLELTDEGALIFGFPDLGVSQTIDESDGLFFNTQDLGLGIAENLTLSAALFASIDATFTSAAGIDLVGFGGDIVGASGGSALGERSSLGDTLQDALLDNVFLTNLSLDAQITGGASAIAGTADLGLVSIAIGTADPTANFLVADAQLQATLVGTDQAGDFNDRLTFRNLFDAVADKFVMVDNAVQRIEAPGLTSLLGRYDLTGGIVVDGDGQGLSVGRAPVGSAAEIQVVDAFAYGGSDALAQLLLKLGDVKITVAGIPGINENLIDGIGITVLDLRDIAGTFDLKLLSSSQQAQDAIDGLTALGQGDILDSLTAIANMLVVVGETLSDRLPFLADDIPLLNFSILDTIDFAADFLAALQELRRDPQAALNVLEGYLEQAFGPGTVTLTWDGAAQTILFDLELKFLEDARQELPFQLDLAEILGGALADYIGADLAATVSGLVAAGGQGSLVFQPLLSLRFSFGIDLSPTLAEPSTLAAADLALAQLASVSSVNFRPQGGNDLRIVRTDAETGATTETFVELAGLTTLDEVVAAIDAAVQADLGATVSFSYDAATGRATLADSQSSLTDATGVLALFGAESAASAEVAGVQTLDLDGGFADFAAAHSFTLAINGEAVAVDIPADAGRTTAAGFALAVNELLKTISIGRDAISATAAPLLDIALSQLLRMTEDGGTLSLEATNFAEANGYGAISFEVSAQDTAREIEFRIEELGGSNLGRALGLAADGSVVTGDVVGEVLFESVTLGAPRVYLDTAQTGIVAEFTAGIAEGLNVELGLGPLKINVVNGKALVNAGDGSGDAAFLSFTINDIDGDANAGQYDLKHIFDIASDPSASFIDLFGFDAQIGIDVLLPLSDSLGLFDPATDSLSWQTVLLGVKPGASWADLASSSLDAVFEGDLVSLYLGDGIDLSNFRFTLPDLSDFLSNLNVLSLLNDPRLVLEGIDAILKQMQKVFDDFLGDINLPVVGDAIGAGVTFFDDFRYRIIEPALAYASTPLPDGSLPTTVDLLTGFINDQLNSLFGTNGVTYLQAYLDTSGSTEESYVYGVLNFNGIIFDEMMDIDFDFGIPGFNLEVEKGSKIRMALNYAINIGFGYDRNGFFLLNDTDDAEAGIEFIVDAGTFEGSMSVFNVLGIDAKAVTLGSDGLIDPNAGGTAQLTAALTADLFGDTGLTIVNGTPPPGGSYVTSTEAYRNFDQVTPRDGLGRVLDFEKVVYAAQIDTAKLIEFGFSAEIDLQIGLTGNILDPTTGLPIEIGGVQAIPSVAAEVVIKGGYSTAAGLGLTELAFKNVRLDASVLYDAIIAPVLEPIMQFVDPLADFFAFLNADPVKIVIDLLGNVFPILRIASTVIEIGAAVTSFVQTLADTGGWVLFGDFDFTGSAGNVSSGETRISDVDRRDIARSGTTTAASAGAQFGVFGNAQNGLSIEIPLLRDPFSAMDILLGNYEDVDLIVANFTLFNINTGVIDIGDEVLRSFGAPGWVRSIISSVFQATIELRLIAKFTAGYDLSGIVNFVNTLDPERLLDGVFIDAAPGALVDVYIGASFRLNLGIAGVNAAGYAGVTLTFNDPNGDGKLRIPELIAVAEAAYEAAQSNPIDALGYIFAGTAEYGFFLRVWVGISLPWPLPDIKWSTTVFNISDSISFGGNPIPARIGADADGGTVVLNIGARAGANMTSLDEDGDDSVTISGTNATGYNVQAASDGKSISGTLAAGAGAVVIPAGEGNNVVNLGAMNSAPTVTYLGSGRDVITLPRTGVHVVFAGTGDDEIKAATGATGTYIVFGEAGTDSVEIDGGNVIYFGDDDFRARDRFQSAFASGGITEEAIRAFFGLNADGTLTAAGTGNFDTGSRTVNLAGLADIYTALTQLNADSDDETVTVGQGNHAIFTGSGDDVITASLGGGGEVRIFSGDGSDTITAGGADAFIEAGADRDLVIVSAAVSEVWGWGKAAGESGLAAADAATNALAQRDDSDVLIGGAGNDSLYGQIGNEILQGGLGDDLLRGGIGDDIAVGGIIDMAFAGGAPIDITTFDLDSQLQQGISIAVENLADGDDDLAGFTGEDILIGGGGSDTIVGGEANDILLGDFGTVTLSANLIAESVETAFATSAFSGTDVLDGGQGNDILVAGAAAPGESETLVDRFGDNIFIGDFGRAEGAQVLTAATLVTSFASTAGGADSVIAGRGNDLILGGEGADSIDGGLGGDLIIADNGTLDITAGTVTGFALATDGGDVITVGTDDPGFYGTDSPDDLKDVIIGGLGDDTVNAQDGGVAFIGDAGVIALNPVGLSALRTYAPPPAGASQEQIDADTRARNLIDTLAESLTSTANGTDGADSVSTTGGDAALVLGGGADVAMLGDGLAYVLSDDGTLSVTPNDDYSGREVVLRSAESLQAGNDDTVSIGDGLGLVVAGEGADSVTMGLGAHLVLGDDGEIVRDDRSGALNISLQSDHTDEDGDDVVTLGAGANTVILGGGADSLVAGDGGNLVLGDSGEVSIDPTRTTAGTRDPAEGGGDTISTGLGDDVILAGGGSDSIVTGAGSNIVLGDSGTYEKDVAAGTVTFASTAPATGGDDTIEGGTGRDAIVAGAGADIVIGGAGANSVIGDNGTMLLDLATHALRSLQTTDFADGGDDTITTLGGNDVVAGGAGGDSLDTGAGRDVILGDNGGLTAAAGAVDGTVTSETLDFGGDDSILAGEGNDIVIAGLGNDTVAVGQGDDVGLGDDGTVTFRNATDVETIVLTNPDRGGDDSVTAEGASGDNVLIGQKGDDTLRGGTGDDILAGDLVEIEVLSFAGVQPGQSLVDRLARLEGVRIDIGGADLILGGAGRDLIWGGFGADELFGGEGQDMIIGDTALLERTLSYRSGLVMIEGIAVETNFPFEEGGNDDLHGNGGADIMIGNLGPDTFFGNTKDDLLYSDGYAGTFEARWGPDRFTGPTAELKLLTSNFAGPGAIDVVSAAQQDDAIGSPLDFTGELDWILGEIGETERPELFSKQFTPEGTATPGEDLGALVDAILDYLSSEAILAALAELIANGVDPDLIRAALIATLVDRFALAWTGDMVAFDRALNQMVDFILARVDLQASNGDMMGEPVALAAE
ncbi:calcium-binding protein [Roseibacterium sp. SDUM158017]|uniref:beta strand repeat-containing protein n=1 Tax=Roseicyclus salinarum TaxID=3036773 RepID=UPI00241511E8|nr:calcium-binding protein [Roseibacterium sp. SDUM158017]MDG4650076.1 calcium-binding protein [Roseibacterium sp. SDUM158017]